MKKSQFVIFLAVHGQPVAVTSGKT